MPASLQHPDAEWARVKPIIEREYLDNNKSARAVQALLKEHHDFDTTVRKLKLKFEVWHWDKKTSARNYAAMNRVIEDIGSHVVFIVPKMGGRSFTRKESHKVLKESRRKNSNLTKKGKPPNPIMDAPTAYRILEEAGISFEHQQGGNTQNLMNTINSRPRPQWQQSYQSTTVQPEDDHSDDDGESTDSEESIEDTDVIADSSRRLNLENFPPAQQSQPRPVPAPRPQGASPPRMSGALPFQSAFLADLHRTMFPDTPEYRLAGPGVGVVSANDSAGRVSLEVAFEGMDFNDLFSINAERHFSDQHRATCEKVLATALRDYYHMYDRDGQKRIVLEFSAYYVGQFLAGSETLDDYNHVDRQEARSKLYSMLEHGNTQLLSHCYWLSNVVISYDKSRQLLSFYEDCIDCIETSASELAGVLRPWIRFIALMHRDAYAKNPSASPRLSPAALDHLSSNFDPERELSSSITYLYQHQQGASHTCLVLRMYYAWYQCHQGQAHAGLLGLLDCQSLVDKMFGTKHLVTVNCQAMAARAYEKMNMASVADPSLKIAISRLTPCSRFLLSFYHELLLRLARLQIANDAPNEARANLEMVFNFRLNHLGAQAYKTWEVHRILYDLLVRQGYTAEARQRDEDLNARYNKEWQARPQISPSQQSSRA